MLTMNFLRALADLGFYYSFAGVVSAQAGGRLALAALLFQSACFAFSSALRRSRIARTAALVPALLLVFLPVPLADRIVSVPPALYLAYLAWIDNYQLSWRRQADQLSLFWKVFLAAVWVMSLISWEAALSTGIPAALLTAAAQVLLMRALRHRPEVYLQPKYQLINSAGILLLAVAALVLGSEWAVLTAASALGAVYSAVIAPLLGIAGAAVRHLLALLLALLKLISGDHIQNGERFGVNLGELALERELARLKENLPEDDISWFINAVILTAEIIAGVAVVALLFHWMARRRYDTDMKVAPSPERSDIPGQRRTAGRVRSGTYAYRIRRQYRAFLRLGQSRGLAFKLSDTSTDVGEKSLDIFQNEEALAELRDIYQRARYQGAADRKDLQRFRRLLGTLKKA